MKGLILVELLICFCQVICESKSADNRLIANAFVKIFEEHFEKREAKVDVIYYGVKGGSSEQIAELVLQAKPQFVSVKLSHLNLRTISADQSSQKVLAGIHIFDSNENFYDMIYHLKWFIDQSRRYEQLFYVPGFNSTIIAKLPESLGFFFVNINFLILQKVPNSIDLVATFLFTPTSCRALQPTTINRYHRNTQQWENSVFFPKRFQNFNRCNLTFREINTVSYNMLDFTLHTLEQHLNFSISRFKENANISSDGIIGYTNNYVDNEVFVTTPVIESDRLSFMIPPGELYTQFEKLFMAFEVEVWIAIGATFVIKLIAIQIINFMSVKVQKFVFGCDIKTPTLNLISIFLQGGQHRVPRRNFARFILTLVLVWTLIIRTCYQSKLFEFLQADLRKPQVQTIDELIENNFTLLHLPYIKYDLDPSLLARFRKKKPILEHYEEFSNDFRHKGTMLCFREEFSKKMMKKSNRDSFPPFYLLNENIKTIHRSMLFTKTIPFFERFNEIIGRMVDHGLTQYESKRNLQKDLLSKPEPIGPQVLTMEHIGIGFIAVLIFLGLSVVVFVAELVYHSLRVKFAKRRIQ